MLINWGLDPQKLWSAVWRLTISSLVAFKLAVSSKRLYRRSSVVLPTAPNICSIWHLGQRATICKNVYGGSFFFSCLRFSHELVSNHLYKVVWPLWRNMLRANNYGKKNWDSLRFRYFRLTASQRLCCTFLLHFCLFFVLYQPASAHCRFCM